MDNYSETSIGIKVNLHLNSDRIGYIMKSELR